MAQSSVIGVVTAVYEPQSGTSVSGNSWVRQSFVIQKISSSQKPSFVCLDIFGEDRIAAIRPTNGQIGEFFFDAESRESQKEPGKWFTSLTCYKVQPFQMATQQQPVVQQQQIQSAQQPSFTQSAAPSQTQQQWPQAAPQQGGYPKPTPNGLPF